MYLTISESMTSYNFWPGYNHDIVLIDSVYTSKFAEWLLAFRDSSGYNNEALLRMLHLQYSNDMEDDVASTNLGLHKSELQVIENSACECEGNLGTPRSFTYIILPF